MNGIILIDKPQGFTSFDVIAKLRGILKTKKLGHSGTLDPMATGVLPVFIGRATKAIDLLPDGEKRYRAEFKLGYSSDTQDATGEITEKSEVRAALEDIEKILPEFRGKILQLPPMYSAVKVGGKRLYDIARSGGVCERKAREIEIYSLEILSFDEASQSGTLDVSCSKGTYIRTLINDIGERVKTLGVMSGLRRTYSQGFDIKDCVTLEEVESAALSGSIGEMILPVESCFTVYPKITLTEKLERLYSNGVQLDKNRIGVSDEGLYRVYGKDFIGIGKAENGIFSAVKSFGGDDNN